MAKKEIKLQAAKVASVADIKARFETVSDYIFTEYRGLTVGQITTLRTQLREKGCTYKVVKNNFARIAFEEMKASDVSVYLKGPTAIALPGDEANAIAKILFDFAKEVPALKIKGALIGGEIYDAAKIELYSKLPGKKELISMLMSAMLGNTSKLARTLQAVADQKAEAGTKTKADVKAEVEVKAEVKEEAVAEVKADTDTVTEV
ncbi:MAG TPA: 50S ribosomal protein L10 [Treponemataceae bacterium]|nr:50S ribosomal protein L10 [Treponemataceae bacterium]